MFEPRRFLNFNFTSMNSAGWRRRARQTAEQLILCFALFLCLVDTTMWHHCDNGKLWLEKDLPLSAVYRCAGTSWSESTKKLPSIDTRHPLQPAMSVCMQNPITYNLTIPSSGAHRPVGAESGEYLYCPPQRWLNNLQHGATVFLYHPCAPLSERVRLSVLAQSCLSHYIMTPHYELGANRPFAMVSWGCTLELSHVTESEACSWLELNAGKGLENRELRKQNGQKYNLYLTRPADAPQLLDTGERGAEKPHQSLKHCCEESLSRLREDAEMDRWKKKRRRRAAFSQGKGQREKREDTHQDSVKNVALMSKEKNMWHKQRGDGVIGKIPEDVLSGQQTNEQEPQKTHIKQRDSQTQGAVEGKGESPGQGWENQKRETSRLQRYEGDANSISELHRENGHPKPQQRILNLKDQQDSRKAGQQGAPRCCGCTEAPAMHAGLAQRQPTRRTDEAVWAAAALGFLLVLLALSVLHTRLYRHWRTMPSLYWHHPRDDYDSVADVVRRRLKMSGGKKRRAPQSRRQEWALLPSSSTEEESE